MSQASMPLSANATKILFISRNLPPLTGGMERLAHRLHDGLADNHEITLIGPTGCSRHMQKNVRTVELPQHPILFILLSTLVAIRMALQTRFDVCIGTNGLMAPACFIIGKIFDVRSVVLVHGLDLVAPSALYQSIFIPLIRGADKIIANSTSTKAIAVGKGVLPERICIINPGVDLPPPDEMPKADQGAPSPIKTIVFVGRILTRKGLSAFIGNSLRDIVDHYSGNCVLVVVGDSPNNAVLKDSEEANRVKAALHEDIASHVQFLGKASDAELNRIYQLADVLILPLVEVRGDIEGFGMVVLEAAARGVPSVAFDIGGVADAITADTGILVEKNDYAAFTRAVIEAIDKKDCLTDACREHAKACGWEKYLASVAGELAAVG